ncbi:hypothetical protein BKA59DRAFT_466563 [Fusarium tricinctum]|uniref:Uncharacterized protein n=1 Tax=Fusarium tricinctum TaxID=61284 RepID=A0A8K0WI05_9HYPO|nr:hypothetical protein BKA59DRAFT_466563 [Fusarium tricinctum]
MGWLSLGSLIPEDDLRTLTFSDVRPSYILSLVKPKERPLKTEIWNISTEAQWNEWLSRLLSTKAEKYGSAIQLLLCGRAKKRFSDPLILANLPFPKSVFGRIKTAFRIHRSVIRVINRNTSCTFVAFPTIDIQEDPKECIVYNYRTACTWPGDLALSASFFPRTLATHAVVYGCDEHHVQMLMKRLTECGHDMLNPMILPTLLAEIERERHVSALRQNSMKTVQRIHDLTVNKKYLMEQNGCIESSSSNSTQEDSVIAWLNMNHLKNGLQNWQQQIRKMVAHIDDMTTTRRGWDELEDVRIG